MGLLSFLKRQSADQPKPAPSKPSKEAVDAVQQARTRARQRLIGAAVLVVAGVIGFPLLFATQPRPLPVDTPIEIARRDGTVTSGATPRPAPPAVIVNESPAEAGRDVTPAPVTEPEPAPVPEPAPAPKPDAKPEAKPEAPKPAPKPAEKPADKPAPKPAERKPADKPADKPAAKPADDARAQALLNGQDTPKRGDKPAAAEAGGRFIVQVGAFSEMNAAREARQKVEKLGLKTYTQVVETSAGNRIRVRVGPFANRAEADRAAGKIKSAGLGSAVFTL
jgi:DedD protein